MKKIVKLKEKQLEKTNIPGNLLYVYKYKYHFADSFCNSMIINDAQPVNDLPLTLNFLVEKHFINFLNACKLSNNSPAILTIDGYTRAEDIEEALGKKYMYLDSDANIAEYHDKPFYMNITHEKFETTMEKLFESRKDIFPLPNNICVFIFMPEDKKLSGIERITTISRSRNIFVTTYIDSKQQFEDLYSPEIYEILDANSKLIFKCNQKEIVSIETRPYGSKSKIYEYKRDLSLIDE